MSSVLDLMQTVQTDVFRMIPRFLMADKNGYALSKAIETAMKAMTKAAQEGLEILLDVEKMPEWRLDEMALEYNCLYDFSADVEAKREWIRNERRMNAILGTPEGVIQYLRGYFDNAEIMEFWKYNGSPFHFRVIAEGSWSQQKANWVMKAVSESKNVRSVLDNITIRFPEIKSENHIYAGLGLYGTVKQTFDQTTIPEPDLDGDYVYDGNGELLLDGNGIAMTY